MIPKEVISATYDQFVNSSSIMWAMPGIERIFAMMIHMSLSVIILYAVKERKYIYYVLAILIHAVINFPAALYQVGAIKNIFMVEGILFITVLILVLYIFKIFIKKFNDYNEIL